MTENTGYQTLEVIAEADNFNQWMYETIRPYCHDSILEIGSGIGNISQFFIKEGSIITLSDTGDFYFDYLKKKFKGINILSIDLVHKNFDKEYNQYFETFDTIVFLNVLEHIGDDESAIENCRLFLKPGGYLIVLVPAYPFLFSKMDMELEHYRRYTAKSLTTLIRKKRFIIKKAFYFNALGVMAWTYGNFFKLHSIPQRKMRTFNRLVPFAKFIDKILFRKAGLSVIVIAQKKDL